MREVRGELGSDEEAVGGRAGESGGKLGLRFEDELEGGLG